MPYEKTKWTTELNAQFGNPDFSRYMHREMPNEYPCIVNTLDSVALIECPFDHSTYPDRQFFLVQGGLVTTAWEIVESAHAKQAEAIDVYIKSDVLSIEETRLVGIAKQAFSAYYAPEAAPKSFIVKRFS